METTKNESITTECLSLVKQVINILGGVFEIAALEAELTGKSLLNILAIVLSIFLVLASTWISLLILFVLVAFFNNVPIVYIALACLLLNAFLILLLGFLLKWQQKNLGFKATRKQLITENKGEEPL